ncbi:MAG: ABC transporter permease [Gemmatimonadetes bacterium]|nr:ABC transporter permease [Gemmatimonadota bacterium]NNK62210.1 ABC transporter permease subunit [Gemmatimonadota bacterium]
MNTGMKVARYQARNVLRARALIGYALFFLVATVGLVRMGGGVERVLPSLASLMLFSVPLVCLAFTTVSLYDARAFNELLLSQPVSRRVLFRGLYAGLTLPLAAAFVLGVGGPLLLAGGAAAVSGPSLLILGSGVLLTAVFVALGFVVAFSIQDAARGLAAALVLWLGLTVVYDGLVLLASHTFAAYPLERPMLLAMVLNPVDLARLLSLMALDASMLLGYTGAVFRDFFGGVWGVLATTVALGAWVAVPYALARRRFSRMDF